MKTKNKRKLYRYLILLWIFLVALLVYSVHYFRSMEKSNTVYSSLSEARLPLLYVEKEGRILNEMYGFMQDMGRSSSEDSLTVLPADRQLRMSVEERNSSIASIQYEIRSLDLTQLIERGSVTELSRDGERLQFQLPIQNLIEEGQQYLLKLSVDVGEHSIFYYTRIVWLKNDFSEELLSLAEDFSRKSFSKTEARSLSAYLESTDTADNSSLSHVNLHSSFQQLTFGSTGMLPSGDFHLRLKEISGIMGEVQVRYLSSCTDKNGESRSFWNEDNYVFRYDPQRIFIMSFDRKTEEELVGASRFSGNRLLLGVQNEEELRSRKSDSGQFTAMLAGGELYRYDNSNRGKLFKLFSFDSQEESRLLTKDSHNMRILSVKNNGDVDFIVYGYMSRGQHEGYSGLLFYSYDNSEDTVIENFFLPIADNAGKIREDIEKLSYLNENGLFYFYYDGSIYGVDTNSFEVVTVAEELEDWEVASSGDSRYVAFQDKDRDSYESEKITYMDLSQDKSSEIREEGKYLRVLGFIGEDFIYGLREQGAEGETSRREKPVNLIRIADTELNPKTDYQKENVSFGNIQVGESRIRFEEYRNEGGSYRNIGSDSIISNRDNGAGNKAGLKNYQDELLQKCWYLEISELGKRKPGLDEPARYSIERSSSIELTRGKTENAGDGEPLYYAYALGQFRGSFRTLEEAYQAVYEDFGYVKDEEGRMLWNRSDKQTIVRVQRPLEKVPELLEKLPELRNRNVYEGYQLLNAYGMDLNSVLYYVSQGTPVLCYYNGKNELISGYNQFNVTILDPESGTERILGREEAAEYFRQRENSFAVELKTAG